MYFSNSLRVKNCFRQFSLFNFQGSALSVRKLIKYITNILVCQALFSTFCKFFLLFCFFRSFPEDFYSFPVRGRPSRDSLFIIPASFPFVKPFFKVFCGFLQSFSGILDVVCLEFLGGTDGGAGVGEHCCGRKQLPQSRACGASQHAADAVAAAREPFGRMAGVVRPGKESFGREIFPDYMNLIHTRLPREGAAEG